MSKKTRMRAHIPAEIRRQREESKERSKDAAPAPAAEHVTEEAPRCAGCHIMLPASDGMHHGWCPVRHQRQPGTVSAKIARTFGIVTESHAVTRRSPVTQSAAERIESERVFENSSGMWPGMPGAVSFFEVRVTSRFNGENVFSRRVSASDFAGRTSFPCTTEHVSEEAIVAMRNTREAEREARSVTEQARWDGYRARIDAHGTGRGAGRRATSAAPCPADGTCQHRWQRS